MVLTKQQEEWLVALESGKYAKGRGFLHLTAPSVTVDEYCCLGVACSMFKEELALQVERPVKGVCYNGTPHFAPDPIVTHLRLYTQRGSFYSTEGKGDAIKLEFEGSSYKDLASLNDDASEQNFVKIAEFIRKNAQYIFIPQ